MSDSKLPERASLEYLRKPAKDRLHEMRRSDPKVKLAAALLALARDHGFASWRALKAEVERRKTSNVTMFFEACVKGDLAAIRSFLANDPGLIRAHHPDMPFPDASGLHAVAVRGLIEGVRVLLEHGADIHARDTGDNATPLHWAAGQNPIPPPVATRKILEHLGLPSRPPPLAPARTADLGRAVSQVQEPAEEENRFCFDAPQEPRQLYRSERHSADNASADR